GRGRTRHRQDDAPPHARPRLRHASRRIARDRAVARLDAPQRAPRRRGNGERLRTGSLLPPRIARRAEQRHASVAARARGAGQFPCGAGDDRGADRRPADPGEGEMRARWRNTGLVAIALAAAAGMAFHALRGETRGTAAVADSREPDHKPHAENLKLSDEKIAAAGIELQTAGPAVLQQGLSLNGIIQPNQEALVQVTPRFPGVVRDVHRRVGDQVAKGDLLATVESNQSLTSYELKAPIAGTIIDRSLSLGEYASEQ